MHDTRDLITLGAHCMATRELLLAAGVDRKELDLAEAAFDLLGPARARALATLNRGPQLLAALELARRAWMLPSPAGRRIRSPVDVAAICAPRMSDAEPESIVIALDKRLTVARLAVAAADPASALRVALGAETVRFAIAWNRRGQRAVPDLDDTSLAEKLSAAAGTVGVKLIDIVILGDDGFCSLLRLGMLNPTDPRYR